MSGLPATFPCPWCGMSYPAKPVLVGKPVRCKGCKNAFVLQADGVATKVEDAPTAPKPITVSLPQRPEPEPVASPAPVPAPVPPTPPPVPVVPAPRPAPAPVTPAPSAPASTDDDVLDLDGPSIPVPAPARTPTPRPAPQPASERVARRSAKSDRLAVARAQMSAQLSAVAAQAAASEAVKREERKSERIAKAPTGTATPSKGGAPRPTAVLTGHGERVHRENTLWWVGAGVVCLIGLLLAVVFSIRSEARSAVDTYAAPVGAAENRYPALGDAVRSRGWLLAAPSMPLGPLIATDLSDASFGSERSIALSGCAAALGELKGLRFDADLAVWLAPASRDKARAAAAGRRGAEAAKAIAEARIRVVEPVAWQAKLGLSEEDARIVVDLIAGTVPRGADDIAKRMLDEAAVPDRLRLRPFHGNSGELRIDSGRPPYRPLRGPYRGVLLRFDGAGWPVGWRVLYVSQADG